VQVGHVDQSRDALDPNPQRLRGITGAKDEVEMGKRSVPSRASAPGSIQGRGSSARWARCRAAESRAPGEAAEDGLQPAAAGRTDQRPRRVDTRALEKALLNFLGCAVVISHDRWSWTASPRMLAFEGDSEVVWFEGTTRTTRRTGSGAGRQADRPHRIKYRKLTR
jgi:hypothetical protein